MMLSKTFACISVLVFLSTVYSLPDPDNAIEDKIRALLEDLRGPLATEGLPDFGIPPLDPLNVNHTVVNITIPGDLGVIKGTVDDLISTGLTGYIIDHIKFSVAGLKFEINLTFPLIDGQGLYNITAEEVAGRLNIFGNGPFTLELGGLRLAVKTKLNLNSETKIFSLDFLNLDVKLESFKNNFENLMNGGELGDYLNSIISDVFPKLINNDWSTVAPMVEERLLVVANEVMKENSDKIWELIFG